MQTPLNLLKFAAKAILNSVGAGLAGDFVVDVLPGVARDLWAWWGGRQTEGQTRGELEVLAQLPAEEYRQAVSKAVESMAGDQPPQVRQVITDYLAQWPDHLRRSLRRPSDPAGTTIPRDLRLRQAEDLLPLLPPRLPRFHAGERPLPGVPWELETLLGSGGFGEVWKARNSDVPGLVAALKFCIDPEAAASLRNEARLLERIIRQGRHPGIVTLQQAYLRADPPCLEYEYVEGGELTALILEWHKSKGGPTPAQAAQVMLRLAQIVGHAHRLEPPIVHRDLKPANILVRRTPKGYEFKVADFGIGAVAARQALVEATRRANHSSLHVLQGAYTPLYASPEQMRGEPASPREDVYALGVIWWQLLSGDLGTGAPTGRVWTTNLVQRGMSEPLIDLLTTCMEPQAKNRPADAEVLAQELMARTGQRASTSASPPQPDQRLASPARTAPSLPQAVRPHRGDLISNLGFLSFLLPFPLGPITWLLGNLDLGEMKAGRMDLAGEPATRTGRLCGKISTLAFLVLFAVGLFLAIGMLTFGWQLGSRR